MHPQVISGRIAALGVIFSGTWERKVVTSLASLVTLVDVVLEVHATGITPVFPLTPRPVAVVPTVAVALCGPGGIVLPWNWRTGVDHGLLG